MPVWSAGDSVWSSRGVWTTLKGKKQGKDLTIGIIDHPLNVGYPTYWHARAMAYLQRTPSVIRFSAMETKSLKLLIAAQAVCKVPGIASLLLLLMSPANK
jgi:hypothetical protein